MCAEPQLARRTALQPVQNVNPDQILTVSAATEQWAAPANETGSTGKSHELISPSKNTFVSYELSRWIFLYICVYLTAGNHRFCSCQGDFRTLWVLVLLDLCGDDSAPPWRSLNVSDGV